MPSTTRIRKKTLGLLHQHLSGESMDYKQLIAIIVPILVDQAFLILMSLLNTAMISSAGVSAVSAVSMVDSLNIFLINVFIAIATGGTVIVAQYKGSGNTEMVSKTATQAISAVTISSVILSAIVIIFHRPTLSLLFGNAEPDVFNNAILYLIGSALSYPLIGIFQAVTGSLRGTGETKPVLILSLGMNLLNLILNFVLITLLDMSVLGLVISTLIARLVGMAASLLYIIRFNETIQLKIKNALHLDWFILRKVMYIGVPFAAEQLFFNGGKLLTQTFIVQLGTMALTANAIAGSLSMVLQIGPGALSIAIVTVVGQCIGQRNIPDARKFTRSFLVLSSVLFVLTSAIMLPLFPLLMKMFSAPAEIIPTIFGIIVLCMIAQPLLWSISFVLPSALRAAGDSKFTTIVSLLSMWLFRVVLGYVLGITLGFGIIGVWAAMAAEWGVRGLIYLRRFKGDKWYAHKLI